MRQQIQKRSKRQTWQWHLEHRSMLHLWIIETRSRRLRRVVRPSTRFYHGLSLIRIEVFQVLISLPVSCHSVDLHRTWTHFTRFVHEPNFPYVELSEWALVRIPSTSTLTCNVCFVVHTLRSTFLHPYNSIFHRRTYLCETLYGRNCWSNLGGNSMAFYGASRCWEQWPEQPTCRSWKKRRSLSQFLASHIFEHKYVRRPGCMDFGTCVSRTQWAILLNICFRYGTPYLLKLGVSDQVTSLVWLAGICALISFIQHLKTPQVLYLGSSPSLLLVSYDFFMFAFRCSCAQGALSDASSSRYRRRVWIAGSTSILVLSALVLAFSTNVAQMLLYLTGSDAVGQDQVAISVKQVDHNLLLITHCSDKKVGDYSCDLLILSLRFRHKWRSGLAQKFAAGYHTARTIEHSKCMAGANVARWYALHSASDHILMDVKAAYSATESVSSRKWDFSHLMHQRFHRLVQSSVIESCGRRPIPKILYPLNHNPRRDSYHYLCVSRWTGQTVCCFREQ